MAPAPDRSSLLPSPAPPRRSIWRWFRRILRATLSCGCSSVLLVLTLPIAQVLLLKGVDPPLTLTMVDRCRTHHSETGTLRWPAHSWAPIDALPEHLIVAAVSAEDAAFFTHSGFDLEAIHGAWKDYQEGDSLRGGSTISQQTAKNVFLWQQRSWLRKGLEAYYTLWLELLLPKHRILEVYLNVAELGPMTFGVEEGARHWFDTSASELTQRQAALLVALLPSPRHWTPQTARVQRTARRIRRAPAELPEGWADGSQ